MIRRISDRRSEGVSEVIGALMLTLIVVASLSAFFLFISDQQDEYQKIEDHRNDIKNESLLITDIEPYENSGSWNRIVITISSEWTEESRIRSLRINDNEVKKVWSYDASSPPGPVDPTEFSNPIEIEGRATWSALILLDQSWDFYDNSTHEIPLDSFIKIDIRSTLGNIYSRTFVPPTAVFKVNTEAYWDLSSSNWLPMATLDATDSVHISDEEYIVEWTWSVISDTDDDDDFDDETTEYSFAGVKVRIDDDINTGHKQKITLTVTDNIGLQATDDIIYYI
jgi:hypothetical protein